MSHLKRPSNVFGDEDPSKSQSSPAKRAKGSVRLSLTSQTLLGTVHPPGGPPGATGS